MDDYRPAKILKPEQRIALIALADGGWKPAEAGWSGGGRRVYQGSKPWPRGEARERA